MARKRTASKRRSKVTGIVRPVPLGDFSQQAMKTYGSYVLMDRAVADVRDGLKPVQRRILWAMNELKLSLSFKKSAKIVGDTMGNYHPHGDSAIYQAMVNMVWDRYPLVEGHGNFGSPTDNAASMRYTEAKLTPLAAALFEDVPVAEFVSNYSGDRKEPLVLPSRLPLLLLNGSSGIGVGLRATLPPHNLRELLRCLIYFIKKENPRISSVVKNMPGPDYGYGVLLSPPEEVQSLYETGKGSLRFRCEYRFEEDGGTPVLVVSSLAPGFNMPAFLKKMRGLQDEGLIEFCSDGSSAEGIRVYVGFKDAGVIQDRVLPELHTSQSYQFYVVRRKDDEGLSDDTLFSGGLFRLFQEFYEFRHQVEGDRLARELKLAKAKLLRAKAILAAVRNLDKVYDVLKQKHPDLDSLRVGLAAALAISEVQAHVVLEMPVHRLSRMNEDTQLAQIAELRGQIQGIKEDLDDIDGVIVRNLKELLAYSDDRGTKLADDAPTPSLTVEETLTWVMAQGSKITRLAGEPSRRNKLDFVASGVSFVTAVYENNDAEVLSTSFLTEQAGDRTVVGLVGDQASLLAALDSKGRLVVLNHPPGKKQHFNLMKDATQLLGAVGVQKGGYLALVAASGVGRIIPFGELSGTRAFVKGHKMPLTEMVSRKVPTRIFGLPPGAALYDKRGKCLTSSSHFFSTRSEEIHAIGTRNFVAVKGGKRDIVSGDDAAKLLKRGGLEHCWILD